MKDGMGIELAEQPEVWSRLWSRRSEVADVAAQACDGRLRRVLFTGCGDCHAAAEYAERLLELRSELEVHGLAAMELARSRSYLLTPETLLVAMSVSGRTPRVLEAVRVARRRRARVLALTDDPESPLAREVPLRFVLQTAPPGALLTADYKDPDAARYSGYQRAVPQTKTFGAMQLALALICLNVERACPSGRGTPGRAVDRVLSELPGLAEAASAAGHETAQHLAGKARQRAHVTFCGTGVNASTARYSAYKLLELTCPAAHSEVEEFCHTHYLVTGSGDVAVFLAHDGATLGRIEEIVPVVRHEIGAAAMALSTGPRGDRSSPWLVSLSPVPPEVSPILLAYAAGHLTRALALAWGLDTDRFRAGVDEERYVRGSTRMIRESKILDV